MIFTCPLKSCYITKPELTGVVDCQREQPTCCGQLTSVACFQLFGSKNVAFPLLATTELTLVQLCVEADDAMLCPVITTKAWL